MPTHKAANHIPQVAHELNVEQFWRGYFGAKRGARRAYSGSYINDEQRSMATKEAAKMVKHLVREPLVFHARGSRGMPFRQSNSRTLALHTKAHPPQLQ